MRLCRFVENERIQIGLYDDLFVTPLAAIARARARSEAGGGAPGSDADLADALQTADVLDCLPPDGRLFAAARALAAWAQGAGAAASAATRRPRGQITLLTPIAHPNKLLLLAGNYAAHVAEGGDRAVEAAQTFPYVFSKPPTTTLTDPDRPVVIPRVSPDSIDWEIELCVVMGRRARHCAPADALACVAGYTVANDISDRRFRPNPGRHERPNDPWFDWECGKWHDTFFPCGPCVASADSVSDPQALAMKLWVNGQLKQDASTAQQIFSVAQVVAFVSDILTLEPGDLISTGTPAGVGWSTQTFLAPGDRMEAWIEGIGTLANPVIAEPAPAPAPPAARDPRAGG